MKDRAREIIYTVAGAWTLAEDVTVLNLSEAAALVALGWCGPLGRSLAALWLVLRVARALRQSTLLGYGEIGSDDDTVPDLRMVGTGGVMPMEDEVNAEFN